MARLALCLVLLSLVCSCALATGSAYVYQSGAPNGVQVPYEAANPNYGSLYIQNSTITLVNATSYTISTVYYYYQTGGIPFKGYLSPLSFSGYYQVTGLVQPTSMFFAVDNPSVCQQSATPGTTVNLCLNGFAVPFYSGPWPLEAINAGNRSLALTMGSEVRLFAGLPEASTFYCRSGPCVAVTVPGIVTALFSFVKLHLGLINLF